MLHPRHLEPVKPQRTRRSCRAQRDGELTLIERPAARMGFTLVELLVVIAIIALLVSILLPSLSTAREIARTAVCMAHMRGAGNGIILYASEYGGWLPGPNTSGAELSSRSSTQPVGPGDTPPNEPIANIDWGSPALGESLGLPRDKEERLKALFNTELRCPSNKETYDFQYPSASFSDEEVQSFSHCSFAATLAFHVLPGNGNKTGNGNDYYYSAKSSWVIRDTRG
ncbi:MAG: prepilin-type N-terminal cleavage/methylation domain-containing protein [Phycisphaerae bacterium]|nr:prepilin-type N-terminal cleavage/methylation domain-containing protein [Phycisphaerae bacterium]